MSSFVTRTQNNIMTAADGLIHSSAFYDPIELAAHRAFMTFRIGFGLAALFIMPILFLLTANTQIIEILLLCSFITPLFAVLYLSRTGDYEKAQLYSTLLSASLICLTAMLMQGAYADSLLVWLLVAPIEASIVKKRRAVINTTVILVIFASSYFIVSALGLVKPVVMSEAKSRGIVHLSLILAFLCVTLLIFSVESITRFGDMLRTQHEEKYQLLAANMTDAILTHNEIGEILFATEALSKLSRIQEGEPYSMVIEKIHPEDKMIYEEAIKQTLKTNEPSTAIFRLVRAHHFTKMPLEKRLAWLEEALKADIIKGGTVCYIEMRCHTVNLREKEHKVVSVWRDVTERKIQEEHVAAIQKETARVQAMKSRFLANVTHELRTPLNAILGFSQMLVQAESLKLNTNKRNEYAGLIHEAGDHLLSVVNSILDMSKLETGKFDLQTHEFNMREAIVQSLNIMRLKANQSNIKLYGSFQQNLPDVFADKRAVRQILLNLLSNAIKFTKEGGSVTTQLKLENGNFVISVADTGIGIDEVDLKYMGDAFYQAKANNDRPYEGTGLGLSIVKGLVRLHNGELKVASKVGVGTVVTVTFPYLKQEEMTSSQTYLQAA